MKQKVKSPDKVLYDHEDEILFAAVDPNPDSNLMVSIDLEGCVIVRDIRNAEDALC